MTLVQKIRQWLEPKPLLEQIEEEELRRDAKEEASVKKTIAVSEIDITFWKKEERTDVPGSLDQRSSMLYGIQLKFMPRSALCTQNEVGRWFEYIQGTKQECLDALAERLKPVLFETTTLSKDWQPTSLETCFAKRKRWMRDCWLIGMAILETPDEVDPSYIHRQQKYLSEQLLESNRRDSQGGPDWEWANVGLCDTIDELIPKLAAFAERMEDW